MNEWLEKYNKYTKYNTSTRPFLMAPLLTCNYSQEEIDEAAKNPKVEEMKEWIQAQMQKSGFKHLNSLKGEFYKRADIKGIPLEIMEYWFIPWINITLIMSIVKYYSIICDDNISIKEKRVFLTADHNARQKYFYRHDKILWIMGEWVFHLGQFKEVYENSLLEQLKISPNQLIKAPNIREVIYK